MGLTRTAASGPGHQRRGKGDSLALARTHPGTLSRTVGVVLSRTPIHRSRRPGFWSEWGWGKATTVARAETVAGAIPGLCRGRAETNQAGQGLHVRRDCRPA